MITLSFTLQEQNQSKIRLDEELRKTVLQVVNEPITQVSNQAEDLAC